jgi:transposase InsO family protein
LEKNPDAQGVVISDNGPQFISKDFHEFIRDNELSHVTTSVYYPQSNGKLERFHGTIIRWTHSSTLEHRKNLLGFMPLL